MSTQQSTGFGDNLPVAAQEIRRQLARIVQSEDFHATDQRRAFLRYIIEETLAGNSKQLKGTVIAQSVFGRDETFDPQTDPVVRLEARRLRRDLDSFYAGEGRRDSLRISIPKGGYQPRFELLKEEDPLRTAPLPASSPLTGESPIAEASLQEAVPPAPAHRPATTPSGGGKGMWKLTAGAGVLALAVLLSFLLWTGLLKDSPLPGFQAAEAALPKGPVVAVLPFLQLGDKPERRYFSQGITQQLTTELARFRDLWILPLGSVRKLQSKEADPQALAEELGADYALEGSVQELGDKVHITARLIDLKQQRYSWVRSYDSDTTPAGIYATQDRITQDVVGNLAGKYGLLTQDAMEQAGREAPENRDAYDCVLRYYSYQIAIGLAQHAEVKACITQAVQLDPGYAEAWAVLSNLYLQEIRFGLSPDREVSLTQARQAVQRSLELDPQASASHLMLANLLFVTGDMPGFKAAGEKALNLNPNSSPALAHFGMRLAFSGEWESGLALVDKATKLNPVHPHWYFFPEVFYRYRQKEYARALEVLDKISMPDFFWVQLWRTAINAQLGRKEEAAAAAQALLQAKPDFNSKVDDILSVWRLEPRLRQDILDGLNKAGLALPENS
ncbi:tetratricopeptide repeat protein [Rhodovibrionaceae bacterium A322]